MKPVSRARPGEPSSGVARSVGDGWLAALALGLWLAVAGCSSGSSSGFYHRVEPGENLYRIGLRYGIPAATLVKANRIDDVTRVRAGTRLWIPRAAVSVTGRGGPEPAASSAARRTPQTSEARRIARLDARRVGNLEFGWPLRGRLTSRFGHRAGRSHDGIDVAARQGAPIHAAEAGRVIHSGRLGDYGKVVVIKHEGHYRSIYAHTSRTLVRTGQFVEKGDRIALVGSTGRSTGPHLHFEIRRRATPRDPMLYLP